MIKNITSQRHSKIKYPPIDEPINESELRQKVEDSILALKERVRKYNLNVKSKINIFTGTECFHTFRRP